MTIKDLYDELRKNGINDERFFLHGLYGDSSDDNKLSMIVKQGHYCTIWEIYYKERGKKDSIMTFNTETEACNYFLKRLLQK